MRILAWNLGHQTRERAIRGPLLDAIDHAAPDVVSFNEFVDGPTRRQLRLGLAHLGLTHCVVSERLGGNNQVLIASREPLVVADLTGPDHTDAGRSNFLHVRLPALSLEVVGLRTPAYEKVADRRAYWKQLDAIIRSARDRRIVFIGDVNANPSYRSPGGQTLSALARDGWQIPQPAGEASWRGKNGRSTRIDFAVASPGLRLMVAAYFDELRGAALVGNGGTRVSDHAGLVCDIPIH